MKNKMLVVIFVFITVFCNAQNLDLKILKAANNKNMPMWDKTMKGVSFSVYPAMPVSVIGIWSYGFYNDDTEMMRNAYKAGFAIGVANGISLALKAAVKRDRPFVTYPNDITQRTHVGSLSFPSGHTTAAFATATALSLSTKKWQVILPSYVYASFVGYSRMRLGLHYPSDVLAGALIGIGSGFLVWQIDKWVKK